MFKKFIKFQFLGGLCTPFKVCKECLGYVEISKSNELSDAESLLFKNSQITCFIKFLIQNITIHNHETKSATVLTNNMYSKDLCHMFEKFEKRKFHISNLCQVYP